MEIIQRARKENKIMAKRNNKIKRKFKITIEVDEVEIRANYPNFDINYSSVEDFIDRTLLNLQVGNIGEFGYSMRIESEE